jgi:hypothetical protein
MRPWRFDSVFLRPGEWSAATHHIACGTADLTVAGTVPIRLSTGPRAAARSLDDQTAGLTNDSDMILEGDDCYIFYNDAGGGPS